MTDRLSQLYDKFPDDLQTDFAELLFVFNHDEIDTLYYLLRLGQRTVHESGMIDLSREVQALSQKATDEAKKIRTSLGDY